MEVRPERKSLRGSLIDSAALHQTTHEHAAQCMCVVCQNTRRLERPRYFAGQLLTEAELNSEQAYTLAKNRLHNRYLHGWGVVCGLEVVCHDCDGWVTITPGYAIDPCGNDIFVAQSYSLDLFELIRRCRDAQRRPRSGCDPLDMVDQPDCMEAEEHWCLTLSYRETEARPITALRNDQQSCGCGSNGGASTGGSSSRSTTRMRSGIGQTIGACEPTRIQEGYCIGAMEKDGPCAPRTIAWKQGLDKIGVKASTSFRRMAGITRVLNLIPADTTLGQMIEKVLAVSGRVFGGLTEAQRPILLQMISAVLSENDPIGDMTASELYDLCCRLKSIVIRLYDEDPTGVHCAAVAEIRQIHCLDPEDPDKEELAASMGGLINALIQYVVDEICSILLPPCPPVLEEGPVVLACVTIRNGKIVNICNWSCRRYAGSFPAMMHWLNVVPILPLLSKRIESLCCATEEEPLRKSGRITSKKKKGYSGRHVKYATFSHALKQVDEILGRATWDHVEETLRPKGTPLETMVGAPTGEVDEALTAVGIASVKREVRTAEEIIAIKEASSAPAPVAGEKIMVYTMNDRVVGFQPYDVRAELADREAELNDLRLHVMELSKEVAALKKAPRRQPAGE